MENSLDWSVFSPYRGLSTVDRANPTYEWNLAVGLSESSRIDLGTILVRTSYRENPVTALLRDMVLY